MDFRIWGGLVFVVFVLVSAGFLFSQSGPGSSDLVNASFSGSSDAWAVLEIADNETERSEGLMNVSSMDERRGMLFKFEEESPRTFWMKNTLIPLDMIFLTEDREVINVETAYPEPNTIDENLERYSSDEPAKYVIEVNAGFAEKYSIEEGSSVEWSKLE